MHDLRVTPFPPDMEAFSSDSARYRQRQKMVKIPDLVTEPL